MIGVEIDGEARAYPLRVLNWHEVVNDTLGGMPIAVTYHPLCDSAVVFDRRVGGEVLRVRRQRPALQLQPADVRPARRRRRREPVEPAAGPRGGRPGGRGRRRGCGCCPPPWPTGSDWLERHPDTTVVEPDPDLLKRYQRDPYGNYLMTGQLRFPVEPLPPRVRCRR